MVCLVYLVGLRHPAVLAQCGNRSFHLVHLVGKRVSLSSKDKKKKKISSQIRQLVVSECLATWCLWIWEGGLRLRAKDSSYSGCSLLAWYQINSPWQWCWAYLVLLTGLLFETRRMSLPEPLCVASLDFEKCWPLLFFSVGWRVVRCLVIALSCFSTSEVPNQFALSHFYSYPLVSFEFFLGFIDVLSRTKWV